MVGRGLVRCVVGVVALIGAVLWSATPVAAHTDFESSTPTDGDVVDEAVTEMVIRFTGEATPAGEGFTVLDPTGGVRSPSSVTTEDDKVFVLEFEPPLAGGVVGVRWMVQARDAHPIEGSFSFTVAAPVPAPPPTTATPATTTTTAPTTTELPTTTAAPATTAAPPAGDSDASGVSLEEFLATESSKPGQGRQLVGRVVSYLAVIGALGGLAFVAFTLRGTRREIKAVLLAVAGSGVLTALGAGIEYWGWLAQSGESVLGGMTSTPGLAMTMRAAGGLTVAGSIVVGASGRRRDLRASPGTVVGAALLVASFWFDGHTVSEGPRIVHAAANSVHVVAAAVWAGGVLALLGVVVGRRRRGEPARAAELVVRFSSIATVALAAVVFAGAAMAVLVLDSPGELTSTEWGKTLLAKTTAVGIAALLGGYNHFRLRPQFEAAPDDGRLETEFRSTLIAESIVLTFVVIATARLVGAAT